MPWRSKAQEAWGHTPAGERALGGAAAVAEWDAATAEKHLPARVKKKKKITIGDLMRSK
jgi:hypothetical protein